MSEYEDRDARGGAFGADRVRTPLRADKVDGIVDRAIQQAEREGAFQGLKGAGLPLEGLDGPRDPEWWAKEKLRREGVDLTDALPPTLRLRVERERLCLRLGGMSSEAEVRRHVESFNEQVLEDRRRPVVGPASPPVVALVDVDEMVREWCRRRSSAATEDEFREPEEPEPTFFDQGKARARWWRRWLGTGRADV